MRLKRKRRRPAPAPKTRRPLLAFLRRIELSFYIPVTIAWVASAWFMYVQLDYRPQGGKVVGVAAQRPNAGATSRTPVMYEYTVNGRTYTGYASRAAYDRARRLDAEWEWRTGRDGLDSLRVYVSASDPTQSTLRRFRGQSVITFGLVTYFFVWFGLPLQRTRSSPEEGGREYSVEKRIARPRPARLYLSWGALLLVAAMYGFFGSAYMFFESRAVRTTSGVLHAIDVVPTASGRRDRQLAYAPVMRYSFDFDGRTYEGTNVSNARISRRTEIEARAFLAAFFVGQQITVYIPPAGPDEAFVVKIDRPVYHQFGVGIVATLILIVIAPRARRELRLTIDGWRARSEAQ